MSSSADILLFIVLYYLPKLFDMLKHLEFCVVLIFRMFVSFWAPVNSIGPHSMLTSCKLIFFTSLQEKLGNKRFCKAIKYPCESPMTEKTTSSNKCCISSFFFQISAIQLGA